MFRPSFSCEYHIIYSREWDLLCFEEGIVQKNCKIILHLTRTDVWMSWKHWIVNLIVGFVRRMKRPSQSKYKKLFRIVNSLFIVGFNWNEVGNVIGNVQNLQNIQLAYILLINVYINLLHFEHNGGHKGNGWVLGFGRPIERHSKRY